MSGQPVGDPRLVRATELDLLTEFLDTQREILLRKAAGLSRNDLARRHAPSTLSIGGLLAHAALNEDWWFNVRFAGREPNPPWSEADWDADPDWEMSYGLGLEPDDLRELYLAAAQRSRDVVASSGDPSAQSARPLKDGSLFALRWVMLHMIEETARHAGHADLIRESIDGEVGE